MTIFNLSSKNLLSDNLNQFFLTTIYMNKNEICYTTSN